MGYTGDTRGVHGGTRGYTGGTRGTRGMYSTCLRNEVGLYKPHTESFVGGFVTLKEV